MSVATPHDRCFREVAADFLDHHLPAATRGEVVLAGLTISKDSYITKELAASHSDLVYHLPYGEDQIAVYLLFEHKSTAEHWTPLQILRYVVLGMG